MADTSLRSRLQRLFSTNVVVRNVGGKKLKVADTSRMQSVARNNLIDRVNTNELRYIYTGLQIVKPEIFSFFNKEVFSINKIWNKLIENNELSGNESNVDFLHVSNLEIYKKILEKKIKY